MLFHENLFRNKPDAELRRQAAAIFEAAVRAADPAAAVRRHVRLERAKLHVDGRSYDLARVHRVLVVGAGKASAPMARALEDLLGDRITAGVVSVKYGYTVPLERVSLVESGHPIPDEAGRRGAARVLDLVSQAREDDLVVCVVWRSSRSGAGFSPCGLGKLSPTTGQRKAIA